mmetsp:Transcript_428/g.659  ORF Transcript_428/g.659 Transcript_428/m.659 type:complete len:200 (+) Transcript_428:627-1226(+)
MNDAVMFEQVNEWKKVTAINTSFVQISRWSVRRSNYNGSILKQSGEELFQNQSVGYICHLQLIKAKDRHLARELLGDTNDRIVECRCINVKIATLAFQILLFEIVNALMHFLQKGVKVDSAFLGDWNLSKECIHQHAFPCSYFSKDVETSRDFEVRWRWEFEFWFLNTFSPVITSIVATTNSSDWGFLLGQALSSECIK